MAGSLTFVFLFALVLSASLRAETSVLSTRTPGVSDASAVDIGPVPGSQPLQLSVRLSITPDRSAALDQLLSQQTTSSSSLYHRWLTPEQFGEEFGATDGQIATVAGWLQLQGLTVESVSTAKTRILVSGTAAQVQRAFSVTLRQYEKSGVVYFANSNEPSIPQSLSAVIAGVSGFDDMPTASDIAVATVSTAGPAAVAKTEQIADPLIIAASTVDADAAPILTMSTNACSTDYIPSDYNAYHDLLRQANAQGMTVLATSGCGERGTGSFPASLAEATAVTITPAAAPFVAIAARPRWQSTPGLPVDESRHETDLTTSSLSAFAETMNTIVQRNGARLGNINTTLYALAPTKGLYTQPDETTATAAGTWEPATGLGVVDLPMLVKVYPRDTGTISTTTSLPANNITVSYGQPFTLIATVVPTTSANTAPGGTVSFTSLEGPIGTAPLVNGTATLNVTALNVGTYSPVAANYSGDANYAASSSTSPVSITVNIVKASIVATVSPSANVPYGATATVTATVTMPTSSAVPSGPVSAQFEGVAGGNFSATISPNAGGNSATGNIVVSAPPPGSYLIEVSCAGTQNFQCQTPMPIPITTVKGYSLSSVAINPTAPQAGQPVTLTATIGNAGNGTGAYSFTGNVTFYDNGKILASAAVGSNQATATTVLSGTVTHNIVASYSGDANWNGSMSAGQAVSPTLLPSSLTLISNVASSSAALAGVNTVLTATVFAPVANSIGSTGTVVFYDTYNGSVITLGVSTLVPNGPNQSIALLSTTGLPAGTNSVYAVYGGDSNFSTASSASLALTFSDYNVTMIPQTLTINRGQSGQAVLLIGTVAGFTGSVTFGCTPPSNTETDCSFAPAAVSGGGSTTMTIQTTAPVAASSSSAALRRPEKSQWNLVTGASLAVLFCFFTPRRRRLPAVLLLLCAVSLTASFGCGQGNTSPSTPTAAPTTPADPGTPLGTQIFTITTAGSDGVNTVRHNYQYQVTIQ